MTGADGDFEAFVDARFGELQAVATATTGDARAARDLTARALAGLRPRWAELVSTGSPTTTARTAVLTAALTATASTGRGGSDRDRASDSDSDSDPIEPASARDVERDDDATLAALTAVLGAARATARAALAAGHWWNATPALVAACARTGTAAVEADLADLDRALASAHAAALGRPAEDVAWALPAALAATLERLADAAPVSDPVALVRAASGRARGRRLRLGAIAVALALGVAAATATALAWPSTHTPLPTLPPDSQQWAVVTSWAPRGPLAGDPAVAAISARASSDPAAHLLFAGRVGDTTVVLMTATRSTELDIAGIPDVPGPAPGEVLDGGVVLKLWTTPAGADPSTLAPTPLKGSDTAVAADVVALSIEQTTAGAAPVVLVLTRPTVTECFAVTGARPDPDGTVRPVVQAPTLDDGVATFPETPGYPSQVVVGGFAGPPAGTVYDTHLPRNGGPDDLATAQRALLAAVTGYPTEALDTISAQERQVRLPVGTGPRTVLVDATVTVVTTLTPDGGWVRTTRIVGADIGWSYPERLAVVPASDHTHALLPAGGAGDTFVALAPDAATAQLVTGDGRVLDTDTVREGIALLTSPDGLPGTPYRLRLLAPDGHLVHDEVPPQPSELLG